MRLVFLLFVSLVILTQDVKEIEVDRFSKHERQIIYGRLATAVEFLGKIIS